MHISKGFYSILTGLCVFSIMLAVQAESDRFSVTSHPEDGKTVWELHDRESNSRVSILPDQGANCIRYRVGGKPILLEPASVAALCKRPLDTGIPLMFPFSCGAGNAEINFNGEVCRMRPNPTGPKIRSCGLIFRRPFRVIGAKGGTASATLLCEINSNADPVVAKEYLWPFRFQVRFTLDAAGLSCHYTMYNIGKKTAPVMFGIHPYFTGRGPVSIPATHRYEFAENLSNGKKGPFDGRINGDMLLGDINYGNADHFECRIGSVLMRCSREFGFVNIYFPPGLSAVAVEPLIALPDAANLRARGVTGTGLRELPPGESFTCQLRIEPELLSPKEKGCVLNND